MHGLVKARGSGYSLEIPALDLYPGEQVGLIGRSGSGKSTALDLLGLVLRPDSGCSPPTSMAPIGRAAMRAPSLARSAGSRKTVLR